MHPGLYKVPGFGPLRLSCAAQAVATQQISPGSFSSRHCHDSGAPEGTGIKLFKNLALRVCILSVDSTKTAPWTCMYPVQVHAVPAVPASAAQKLTMACSKPIAFPRDKTCRSSKPRPKTGERAPPDWLPVPYALCRPCFNRALFLAAQTWAPLYLKSRTPARDRDRETCLCSVQ